MLGGVGLLASWGRWHGRADFSLWLDDKGLSKGMVSGVARGSGFLPSVGMTKLLSKGMVSGVARGERIPPVVRDDKGLSKGIVSGVARGKRIPPVGRE